MGTAVAMRNTEYVLYLGGHNEAAGCARLALASKLAEWQMSELLEDARLIASELVTNSARLGRVFTLTLRRASDTVLMIEVEDSSSDVPTIDDPLADLDRDGFDDNGGRGLFLVENLASRWGYRLTADGKVVWAELKCR